MKNGLLYILIIFGIFVTSCGSLKKSDTYNKEQIMKADAYAIAYVECKTELTKLMLADNPDDALLKNELAQLNEDFTTLKQNFFRKYKQNEGDIKELNTMKEKSADDLSICKKLTEYKELKEEQEKEQKK